MQQQTKESKTAPQQTPQEQLQESYTSYCRQAEANQLPIRFTLEQYAEIVEGVKNVAGKSKEELIAENLPLINKILDGFESK